MSNVNVAWRLNLYTKKTTLHIFINKIGFDVLGMQ